MKVDYQEGTLDDELDEPAPGTKKMRMSDAISQISGEESELATLNYESQSNGLGDLFERVSVPGN